MNRYITGGIIRVFCVMPLTLLLTTAATGGPPRPLSLETARQRVETVDAYFERMEPFGFSGSVLIAMDGHVLLARGYGLADREAERANDIDTLFDVGSITKPFVAAAVLKSESQGKLSIDDPVRAHIPFDPPTEARWDRGEITIRQLLRHRSGLQWKSIGDPEFIDIDPVKDPQSLFGRYFEVADQAGPPDGAPQYNNITFGALAYIVQKSSGMSFEDYCVRHLFHPAGMTSSGFNRHEGIDSGRAAMGYSEDEPQFRAGELPQGWGYRGATGLITSARDLYRWSVSIQNSTVLSPNATAAYFDSDGHAGMDGRNFGMAWEVERDDFGTTRIAHGGTTHGFASQFVLYPRERLTIIVLCNNLDLRSALRTAEQIVKGEDVELPPLMTDVTDEEMEAVAGRWVFSGGDWLELRIESGELHGVAGGITTSERFLSFRQSGDRDVAFFRNHLATAEDIITALAQGRLADMVPEADMDEAEMTNTIARVKEFERIWEEIEEEIGSVHRAEAICLRSAWRRSSVKIHVEGERGDAAMRISLVTYPPRKMPAQSIERIPSAFVATGVFQPQGNGVFTSFRLTAPDVHIRLETDDAGEPTLVLLGDGGPWSDDLVGRRQSPSMP